MTNLQEMGVQFIQYLQTFHPELDGIMGFLAILVKPEYYLVFILPVFYWNFGKRLIITLLIAVLFDILLGEILRIAFAQPRPWWIADLVPLDPVTSIWSSPSGYSSFTVLFFGFLSYHFKKRWITISSVLIILLTGIAKMYQAAALPDHLLIGMIEGGVVLYLFIKYGEKLTSRFINLSKNKVLWICLGIVSFFYFVTYIVIEIQLTYNLPAHLIQFKMIPSQRLSSGTVYMLGFLLCSLLSLKSESFNQNNDKFNMAIWKRILFSILGTIVTAIFFMGIRRFFVGLFENLLIIGVLNLIFTLIVGFWIYKILPKIMLAKS